jgi:hypothetical protein
MIGAHTTTSHRPTCRAAEADALDAVGLADEIVIADAP